MACCTDFRFTTDFTTDADKNMQKYADICKNTDFQKGCKT